jgi:ketosteroid isomerase-like protein
MPSTVRPLPHDVLACPDQDEEGCMQHDDHREPAGRPGDLSRLFLERANAGDVDGLVALYEPTAALALPTGDVARGVNAIREAYTQLLAERPTFIAGKQRPPLVVGELALTSTRLLNGSATAEVARRQPDGTWLWAADQPDVLG